MNIRLETPKDYREVENLTREAFWNVYRPGCTEHYVLNLYRINPDGAGIGIIGATFCHLQLRSLINIIVINHHAISILHGDVVSVSLVADEAHHQRHQRHQ